MSQSNMKRIMAVLAGALGLLGVGFVLTAPIMSYPISVDLPQRVVASPLAKRAAARPPIDLRVDADNRVYWNDSPVNVAELEQKMEEEVWKDPGNQPELRIDASPDSDYETLGRILAQARNARMKKIGFVR